MGVESLSLFMMLKRTSSHTAAPCASRGWVSGECLSLAVLQPRDRLPFRRGRKEQRTQDGRRGVCSRESRPRTDGRRGIVGADKRQPPPDLLGGAAMHPDPLPEAGQGAHRDGRGRDPLLPQPHQPQHENQWDLWHDFFLLECCSALWRIWSASSFTATDLFTLMFECISKRQRKFQRY